MLSVNTVSLVYMLPHYFMILRFNRTEREWLKWAPSVQSALLLLPSAKLIKTEYGVTDSKFICLNYTCAHIHSDLEIQNHQGPVCVGLLLHDGHLTSYVICSFISSSWNLYEYIQSWAFEHNMLICLWLHPFWRNSYSSHTGFCW